MSIKDRRERQKRATREGILESAHQIAREEGWSGVTIRRVADMIEYSPPVIYEHFANKNAILIALQKEGFDLLTQQMQSTKSLSEDPVAQLLQMSQAYLRFSQEQTALYQLMHGWESASLPEESTLVGAERVAAVVQETLEDWAHRSNVTLTDPSGVVETLWALLHGMVSIEILGRISRERVTELTERAIQDLLIAWKSSDKEA